MERTMTSLSPIRRIDAHMASLRLEMAELVMEPGKVGLVLTRVDHLRKVLADAERVALGLSESPGPCGQGCDT
jgi:hypothetical protein